MTDGFIKVAVATPKIRVADVHYNSANITQAIRQASDKGAKLIVFPELCITAYTCEDLFLQDKLIRLALDAVLRIAADTADLDILSVVGLPLSVDGKLYNTAAVMKGGQILGFVPKSNLPNYAEFYEARHFHVMDRNTTVRINGTDVPIGPKLIFCSNQVEDFKIGCEICEDLWVTTPPSSGHAENGATVIVNLSASDEIIAKAAFRHTLIRSQSSRAVCAYLYADAGEGESTTDLVFAGHKLVYETGSLLAESELFQTGITYTDIDVNKVVLDRRRLTTFKQEHDPAYQRIYFDVCVEETQLDRTFNAHPFVPKSSVQLDQRCKEILTLQCMGLKKRLEHIGLKTVTLGISGGLDSTLALLVTAKAFDRLNLPRSGIIAVTMPCFGTTGRTYQNAKALIQAVGANFREVNIRESVTQHMDDIGADLKTHDVTYENAQARERTQVLMDISNKTGGIVIGTGDLSELALGWATYNGDHMSMYGVNASIPKTLVRYLVQHAAESSEGQLRETLLDILDTPVSPELLPPKDGEISQQTEEIVGPYELHDFFLYQMIRCGFEKGKIRRMAEAAFHGKYTREVIQKWLDIFYRRFFQNQFKRSCIPDGPKVGSVTLSPRGDWRMPSDAVLFE